MVRWEWVRRAESNMFNGILSASGNEGLGISKGKNESNGSVWVATGD